LATDHESIPKTPQQAPSRRAVRRLLPLAAILLLAGVVLATGLHRHLSFETLVRHHDAIHQFIAANLAAAIAIFAVLYIAVVALSIPGALILTLSGGILFGGLLAGAVVVVAATVGASVVFLIAKTAFGENLARRAGPVAEKLAAGFREDAFHYLLFLRLVPVFPFFLVNLVPALAGVNLGTFVTATAIGIVPATFAFAFVGAGLDSVVRAQGAAYQACLATGRADCRVDFELRMIATPELLAGLAALGVLALIPVLVKRLRARSRVVD
jgi:uncharacterized membrane protein YdjX (TVP38/TMEM64 family)